MKPVIIKKISLREIDFGKFVDLTWEESSILYPDIYKTWLSNPAYTKIPKGESVRNFVKRVEICFTKISNQNSDKTVVVVSHGGPIRIILLKILKLGMDQFWTIEQNTAAINIIEFKSEIPQALKINDTSHLG